MSVLTIIQARMASERLPGKVLKPLLGRPMLEHVIRAAPAPRVVVCPRDDVAITELCHDLDTPCVRARTRTRDVLAEFVHAVDVMELHYNMLFTHVLRMTADCPMLTLDHVLTFLARTGRYPDVVYTNRPIDPDGYDLELVPVRLLERAHAETTEPYHREHVTPWAYDNASCVRICVVDTDDLTKVSVDTREEYEYVHALMLARGGVIEI